jgi:predicted nucleotidyltransferase
MQDARLQTVLQAVLDEQRYPLLFLSISGSHLFGFSSPESDYDLLGAHILPIREVIGLHEGPETVDFLRMYEGVQVDFDSYDIRKLFKLLQGKNGNVLEAIYSPLVVHTTPEHAELKAVAMGCVTRYYAYHYLGFANKQLLLYGKEHPRRVKPLIYIYRVILTGLHLMRSGQLEPNLVRLNEKFRLHYIPELIARKQAGSEQAIIADADLPFHEKETMRLLGELEASVQESILPTHPDEAAIKALNDLLIRVRLGTIG